MTDRITGDKCIAAIRIRGVVSAKREARETLSMLHLERTNHAVLIDNRSAFIGMLRAAHDYVTWGEVSRETVFQLIAKRARIAGGKPLGQEYLKTIGFESAEKLAEAVYQCRLEYWKLKNIQPVFRLRPPAKGFKGNVKKGIGSGGELGYRGERINNLLKRMI